MTARVLPTLIFSLLLFGSVDAEKLMREISQPLTEQDMLPFRRQFSLVENGQARFVALRPESPEMRAAFDQALAKLEQAYGVKTTVMPESDFASAPAGAPLVVFGQYAGLLSRRLKENWLASGNEYGYEVRLIPDALDLKRPIVYFGGKTPEEALAGVDAFISKYPLTAGKLTVAAASLLQSPDGNGFSPTVAPEKQVEAMRDLFAKTAANQNQDAIRLLANVARDYYKCGDDRLGTAFMEMIHIFSDRYEASKSWTKDPPSFRFHELPKACDLIEESSALSDADRMFCGEVVRHIAEDCMNCWEMREPMNLYNSDEVEFLTNHPLFASRSVNVAARWLLSRFNIEPALYWKAVSAYAFKGVGLSAQGPEDSGNYQFLSRRLFTDFCIESGEMDYRTKNLRQYIDFAACLYGPNGYMTPFGDAPPKRFFGWPLLKLGWDIYRDPLCAYLLQHIPEDYVKNILDDMTIPADIKPGERLLGLKVFELDPFLVNYYKLNGMYNAFPPINKATFHNSWEGGQYLALGGLNCVLTYHGHTDANAILRFAEGQRLWMVDSDYIRAFPRHHNSISVCRNGMAPEMNRHVDWSKQEDAAAVLVGQASHESNRQAVLATMLGNYAGLDWIRSIFWDDVAGFCVVDELRARSDGNYTARPRFRLLGDIESVNNDRVLRVRQKPVPGEKNILYVCRGDSASTELYNQFDYGHDGPFGYYDDYKYSGPLTRVVGAMQRGRLQAGEEFTFANFFRLSEEGEAAPALLKIGDTSRAWVSTGENPALFFLDGISTEGLSVQAARGIITPRGMTLNGVKEISIAGKKWSSEKPVDGSFTFGKEGQAFAAVGPAAAKALLQKLAQTGRIAEASQKPGLSPDMKLVPEHTLSLSSPVTALSSSENNFAVGCQDGSLIVYSSAGDERWRAELSAPVTAIAPVKTENGTGWAVGTRAIDRQKQTAVVALFSKTGKQLWQKEIPPYHGRPGTISCITGAFLRNGETQQIVAGSESWHFYAYDGQGNQMWKFPIHHAATVVAAADADGDGLDDIAAGTEYPRHWLVDENGKELQQVVSSRGDISVAFSDLNDDGKADAIFGRSDSFIKVMRPKTFDEYGKYFWTANAGGVPMGLAVLDMKKGKRIAVATDMAFVKFLNADGSDAGYTELPAAALTLCASGDRLLVPCLDDKAYVLSASGNIKSWCDAPRPPEGFQVFCCDLVDDSVVFTSGDTVEILKIR